MDRFSQFRYRSGRQVPDTFVGRAVAFVVGVVVLAIAVFLGAVFIAGALGLLLLGGLFVTLRVWWLKRKMERYQAEHGDLDAEYTVVEVDPQRLEQDER